MGDFKEEFKSAIKTLLAPIEVKILISRPDSYREAYKIEMDSGTTVEEIANVSAPKNY